MQRKAVSHCRKKCEPKPRCKPSPTPPCPRDCDPECPTCVIQLAPIPVAERCPADTPNGAAQKDCRFIGCDPSTDEINAAFGKPTAAGCTLTHRDSAVKTLNDCYREQTRTWTATNKCGQKKTLCQTVKWRVDTTGPTVVAEYVDKTVACEHGGDFDDHFDLPEFTDDCDGNLTISHKDVRDPKLDCTYFTDGTYKVTRTWTATDDCQKSVTSSQTITVGPCVPSVTCPKPVTIGQDQCGIEADQADFDKLFNPLTAEDVSGFADPFDQLTIDVSKDITPITEVGQIRYLRTITVTDSCKNQEECAQTIIVPKCITTVPTVTCGDHSFMPCGSVPVAADFRVITEANVSGFCQDFDKLKVTPDLEIRKLQSPDGKLTYYIRYVTVTGICDGREQSADCAQTIIVDCTGLKVADARFTAVRKAARCGMNRLTIL